MTRLTEHIPGYFGEFGGSFVPETLVYALSELDAGYQHWRNDATFGTELSSLLRDYVGRPTPLYFAERLTAYLGGARIYLKREDLAHTGAHKINNAIGQVLLAQRMGKQRIIAETGAGQHGVATATACALLGIECHVYMGAEDIPPAAHERVADGPARRQPSQRRIGPPHVKGRDQRGHSRLGDERRNDALRNRLGRRTAPLPDHRPRLPIRDRP